MEFKLKKTESNSVEAILQNLFQGKYSHDNQCVIWKPSLKESFSVGQLGEVLTIVDTIIDFNSESEKYSLYVFNSLAVDSDFVYQSDADAPTMGLALFRNEIDSLSLVAFNKNVCQTGHMGLFGKLEIIKLGNTYFSLKVDEEEYKETDLFTTFYSINESFFGREVFSFPVWKIISYSETPIIQEASVIISKPKDSSYFDLTVSYKIVKQTEPNKTLIKKWTVYTNIMADVGIEFNKVF